MSPLQGLRVVDLTDDSGRFATKVLTEMGASVVRVHDGDGVTHGPAMRNPEAVARGGLLDWWYDAGKQSMPLDLASAAGVDAYRALTARADLVIETLKPGRLADLGIDYDNLIGANQRLVQVSLTPFGRTGPKSRWESTDLVAAAASGVLSVCGTKEEAIVPWGRQSFAAGAAIATLTGLAAVRSARVTGEGQFVDVSLHEAVTSSLEQIWFQYHYDDCLPYPKIAPRQGSTHWTGSYVVLPCRTGWCMITATPAPLALLQWMIEEDVPGAAGFLAPGEVFNALHGPGLVALAAKFALRHDSSFLFWEAQSRHLAWAEVQTTADLARNEQLLFRGAFVPTPDLPAVKRPRFPVVFTSTPPEPVAAPKETSLQDALGAWPERAVDATASVTRSATARPLEGIRVLDMSWVLAGPFGCRLLGDLGADVLKMQTAVRATSVNDPSFGFYPVFNRSKRSLAVDMKASGSIDIVRRVVERSDVLIENYAAGVLARWGLDWETLHSWNPRLIYVTMSGCGHEGPWSSVVSFGPTIHALSGLTALSNPPGRGDIGAGYALNDMAVGAIAAIAVLGALEARDRTGEGQLVDIAQLEVGSYMVGAGVLDLLANGREAVAAGNLDPYANYLFDDVLKTSEGEVAVTIRHDSDLEALRTCTGGGIDELAGWCAGRSGSDIEATLQNAGVPAGKVQNAHDLCTDDEQLKARDFFRSMDSPIFGERRFERFPAIFSQSVLEPYRAAPSYVGEHNFEILAETTGMSEDEVADAMADGRLA